MDCIYVFVFLINKLDQRYTKESIKKLNLFMKTDKIFPIYKILITE